MNRGGYKLNPFAEAYIPISRRDPQPEKHLSAFPQQAYSQGMSQQHGQEPISSLVSVGGSSQSANKASSEEVTYENYNSTMIHLRSHFPDVADDFLEEAYWTHGGDFGAAAVMLYELEAYTNESSESLPDTLDIGDVPESSMSAQFSSLKLKNIPLSDESSSDSNGPSQGAS